MSLHFIRKERLNLEDGNRKNQQIPTMKILSILPSWLRNKYFISFAVFAAIMLFLDKNDVFTQLDRVRELREWKQGRQYYTQQLASERKELEALKTNPATVEKYAREKLFMKKDHEEIFLISEKPDIHKN